MRCPTCQGVLSPDQEKCPVCGTPNPARPAADATQTNFTRPEDATLPAGGGRGGGGGPDLLGFIVMYAESSDAPVGAPDPRLGRVYAMHRNDVLFIGKAPTPSEIVAKDSSKVAPTLSHLFPFKDEYGHISRRHLVVQMEPGGKTALTDLSTNGIYLLKEKKHLRRGKGQDHTFHVVEGPQTIVLGLDLTSATAAKTREESIGYQIQIIPLNPGAGR